MPRTYIYFTVLFLLIVYVRGDCPTGCQCSVNKAFCKFREARFSTRFFCPKDLTFLVVDLSSQSVFEKLDLNVCKNLTDIIIKSRHVTVLKGKRLSKLVGLRSLTLKCNLQHVDDYIFSGLNLTRLIITGNRKLKTLSNYTLADVSAKVVMMQHNGLTTINERIFNHRKLAKSLKTLILSNNQISVVADKAFKILRNLNILDLSHNRLHSLSGMAFYGLFPLTQLKLSFNQLTSFSSPIFSQTIRSLQRLDLANNKLTGLSIDDVTGFSELTFLSLANNQLTRMPLREEFDFFPKLTTFKVAGNLFSCIEYEERPPKRIKLMTLSICADNSRISQRGSDPVNRVDERKELGRLKTEDSNSRDEVEISGHQTAPFSMSMIAGICVVVLVVVLAGGVVCWKFYRQQNPVIRRRQLDENDDACQEMFTHQVKARDSVVSEIV